MDDLENMLVRDEGLRLMPYRDTVGVLTIGYGRAIGRVGITEAEARILLRNDIARVRAELEAALPFFPSLSRNRQYALVNMAFNLGLAGLLKFKKMLAAVAVGNYVLASECMLQSKWATQVGHRAQRLALLMQDG